MHSNNKVIIAFKIGKFALTRLRSPTLGAPVFWYNSRKVKYLSPNLPYLKVPYLMVSSITGIRECCQGLLLLLLPLLPLLLLLLHSSTKSKT